MRLFSRFLLVAFVCSGPNLQVLSSSVTESPLTNRARTHLWTSVPRGGASNAHGSVATDNSRRSKGAPLPNQYDDRRMPALFKDEDAIYDRYAACLAATEGLRRIRDRQIAHEAERLRQQRPGGTRCYRKHLREAERRAVANYFRDSSKLLKAMGMPVAEFNEIGRRLGRDETLKQKVSMSPARGESYYMNHDTDVSPFEPHICRVFSSRLLSKPISIGLRLRWHSIDCR
jgi:Domain of unknown function (DUF4168)